MKFGWSAVAIGLTIAGAGTLVAIRSVQVRCAMTHTFDRWFAAGYAVGVIVFILAEKLSLTSTWSDVVNIVLKL